MKLLQSDRIKALFTGFRHVSHKRMIDLASLLVPAAQRAEWRREWQGELWHVHQTCAPADGMAWQRDTEVTAFCFGSFKDAFFLAKACRQPRLPYAERKGTPGQCIAILGSALCASYAVALLLPGVQAERSLWPRTANANLVTIEHEHAGARPTIEPAQYQEWRSARQRYFDGFAFYRVMPKAVAVDTNANGGRGSKIWNVGLARSNFFAILGLPTMFTQSSANGSGAEPELILGERVWKREFGADAHVTGSLVRLNGALIRIAGIVPDGALGLPGSVDAWQFSPQPAASESAGYVVAHLTALGQAEMWADRIRIDAVESGDAEQELLGVALGVWQPSPRTIFWFALMLALLSLPAITSVSLGESGFNPRKTSLAGKLYGSAFFLAKIGLLLPIVYFVSLELAYAWTGLGRERAVYIQLASVFALGLFGMRWVLKDQRQRCPVCLSRVVHPAQVGQASRTFLDWNGTEMMCMGGHTLLHVPSLPTSWFSTQRWLYLDTSWDFLFVAPTPPAP